MFAREAGARALKSWALAEVLWISRASVVKRTAFVAAVV